MTDRFLHRFIIRLVALCLFLVPCAGTQALAQEGGGLRSPVLVVEFERLYAKSQFGQRIDAELASVRDELAAENRRIEAELTEEELQLTDQRPSLAPEEFRTLADAFDEKVRNVRRAQDQKARDLVARRENSQSFFLNAVAPILEAIMREAGAAVVLERQRVFVSLTAVDITDAAIARIDAEIGDGTGEQ